MTYEIRTVAIAGLDDSSVKFLFAPHGAASYEYFAPREWFKAHEPLKVAGLVKLLIDPEMSSTFRLAIRSAYGVSGVAPPQAGARYGADVFKHSALTDTPPDDQMTIKNTLAERGERYGDFAAGSELAVNLKETMRGHAGNGYYRLEPAHRQALDIIMDKVSRIINGDPLYADNWHDIAGYATLGEQLCRKD